MSGEGQAAILDKAQPAGRKRVAQCASTGRTMIPYPAPGRGGRTVRGRLLTPRTGAGRCARPLPTAARRGLLSFALRARKQECVRDAGMARWWGGPPGPRGTPSFRCRRHWVGIMQGASRPTGASAEDRGVRPTIRLSVVTGKKYVALGRSACPTILTTDVCALPNRRPRPGGSSF